IKVDPTLAEPSYQADQGRAITLRQLASHSLNLSDQSLKNFGSRISGLEAGEFDPEKYFSSRFQPGTAVRSRLAYRILGIAMENAAGMSFDELLQSQLLIPLEMHGTTARPDSLQGVATGSGLFFGLSFPYDSRVPYIAAPADGIVSTSEDITKFLSYITSPPKNGIKSLPPSSVAGLYQPLLTGGDTGFGWRILTKEGNRLVFQGGSVEGFSSRMVIWPERNAAISILSAQGGFIQSNIVLPWLTSAAEKMLFTGSSPRLFPISRILFIVGISLAVYVISLLLQTATALSWTKTLRDRRETSRRNTFQNLVLVRTFAGIALRAAFLISAPFLISRLIGKPLLYHDLLAVEPGGSTFFIIAMLAGIMRNVARMLWFIHLERG
ncbi:MAG: serine hydrolase domain-containing protein, partial [Rectinemataceae bacterium]|nr:serine hydrolase domain-containing protein [Rectinemataceae bacterium]